jgi:hypothetical protein
MYERPPVAALFQLLSVVVAEHPRRKCEERHAEIRRHVSAVADDLKAAGFPPERAAVAVKQIAFDAGMSPTRGVLSRHPLIEQDAIIVDMVRWCIEHYYGVDIPPRPTTPLMDS